MSIHCDIDGDTFNCSPGNFHDVGDVVCLKCITFIDAETLVLSPRPALLLLMLLILPLLDLTYIFIVLVMFTTDAFGPKRKKRRKTAMKLSNE